jgi:hypothetical protein
MPTPKPRGSFWTLEFVDGPLSERDAKGKLLLGERWHTSCPDDWAYTNRQTGESFRYRLKESDTVRKVATMELVTDA